MSIDRIVSVLDELIQVHHAFIELGQAKTEVIKKGDITLLEKLITKEDVMTKQVQQLEKKRIQAVGEFLRDHDIVPENITLEQLIKLVPVDRRDELRDRQLKLMNTIIELKDLNDLNRQLIEQSLQLVNVTMNLLQPSAGVSNYDRPSPGKINIPNQSTSRFDSKA